MGDRLIFFTGVYDTLDLFTVQFINAFQRMGYETLQIDTRDMEKGLMEFAGFVQAPVKAAVTFNNLGFHLELVPGKNIWEALQIPCINILVDHPCLYKEALETAPGNAVVLCIDKKHMGYLQRFFPRIPLVGFLPHGGKMPGQGPIPIAEREIDVMYAGGLSRKFAPNVMPDFGQFAFDAKAVADMAYKRLVTDTSLTVEEAIEETLIAYGVNNTDEELSCIISQLHYIELLAVSYYREKLIRTMLENGIHVHLYGQGWEICDFARHPNLEWEGKVSPEEVLERMRHSKIVLNTMTWFKDGAHERIFNGMLAGAVAVTDESAYLKDEFQAYPEVGADDAQLLMFRLHEIDGLAKTVAELLLQPDLMQKIADNGRKKAASRHTWELRAAELHKDLLLGL